MSTETTETLEQAFTSLIDRLTQARTYGVKSMQRGADTLDDFKRQGIRYTKDQPVQAVAIAAAVGVIAGMTSGWVVARALGNG